MKCHLMKHLPLWEIYNNKTKSENTMISCMQWIANVNLRVFLCMHMQPHMSQGAVRNE